MILMVKDHFIANDEFFDSRPIRLCSRGLAAGQAVKAKNPPDR